MQGEQRRVDQPAEPRKDVKDRKRRFQIIKLEERIAPGNGNGNGSRICGHNHYSHIHCGS